VFENKVLRGIYGLKRDEITGEWRRLHKEERDGTKKNKMGGACGTSGT
jgi:hypothetical protein